MNVDTPIDTPAEGGTVLRDLGLGVVFVAGARAGIQDPSPDIGTRPGKRRTGTIYWVFLFVLLSAVVILFLVNKYG